MIQNEKLRILEIWKKEPFKELSVSEIMKILDKKTKTWLFRALKLLVNEGILISKRKGNLDIYNLNLNNPLSFKFLQYLEAQESLKFPQIKLVSELIEKIPVKGYSLIIFGSYAENKQKKTSDIDICFLIEEVKDEKKIKSYINDVKLNYPIKIDEHYITFDDFVKMLLRSEENLGKQIFRKHKILYNPDIYYQLVKEAYKNGFR